mgnify:CR=1 FL=1
MNYRARSIVLACAGLLGLVMLVEATGSPFSRRFRAPAVVQQPVVEPVALNQPGKPAAGEAAAKDAVMANVRAFTEAYNRRDVQAILALFADDCVLTELDGTTSKGLKALETELTDTFQGEPNAKISVSVDLLQMVAPDVIVEEGKTNYFPDGKTLTAEADYQATHVKRGGRWVMTRVRTFNRVVLSPYDSLRELEWLIGDWVDEGSESLVEYSYRWDGEKTYLIGDFSVRVKGKKVITGTQRIGRDPLTKQIKSWVFDSEGGYAESLWSSTRDGWLMKLKGVRADGKVVSVTNQLVQDGKDRFRFDAADRVAGDDRMPNVSIVAVRRPPQAKK